MQFPRIHPTPLGERWLCDGSIMSERNNLHPTTKVKDPCPTKCKMNEANQILFSPEDRALVHMSDAFK